jgi:membrane protease YdiL (CAAX protease family)
VLFGALHARWLAGALAGMLYAVAVYRRGELADAVLAHATTNALIAAYVLATGTWSLWA